MSLILVLGGSVATSAAASGTAACVTSPAAVAGPAVALDDPTGVLATVEGDLRLLILPIDGHRCDGFTGKADPNPPEDPADAEIPAAVADLAFGIAERATVQVDSGSYAIVVRGRGTDPVSGRMDAVIATGCAEARIDGGETRQVTVEMMPSFSRGICGDRVISLDEQCDDGGTVAGDGCSDTCRTEAIIINSSSMGSQTLAAAAWRPGGRVAISYDTDTPSPETRLKLHDARGLRIESPRALQVATDVEAIPGIQTQTAVTISDQRIAVAFSDYRNASTEGGDVRIRFFDGDRNPLGPSVLLTAASTGAQSAASVATLADGAVGEAFLDGTSPTGMSMRIVPGGSLMPTGDGSFPVGEGQGTAPALAALDGIFYVAYASAGDIFLVAVDDAGAVVAGFPVAVTEGADASGDQDQPAIAAIGGVERRLLVAYRDAGPFGDGDGTAIRGRVYAPNGLPLSDTILVNTTADGNQSEASVAAYQGRFVVAWQHGPSTVSGRLLTLDGAGALNREPVPTAGDFVIATEATSPAVAAGGDGAWMIVYTTSSSGDAEIGARVLPVP